MNKEEFKAIRKELGRTQLDLASQLGVSLKTISRYELGETKIPGCVESMMNGDSIRHENRIVYCPEYQPLELIINSFDVFKAVYVESQNSPSTLIIAGEINEGKLFVRNYMMGDRPSTSGLYLDDGSLYEFEGIELTNKILSVVITDCYGPVWFAEVEGIGFNYRVSKPI